MVYLLHNSSIHAIFRLEQWHSQGELMKKGRLNEEQMAFLVVFARSNDYRALAEKFRCVTPRAAGKRGHRLMKRFGAPNKIILQVMLEVVLARQQAA